MKKVGAPFPIAKCLLDVSDVPQKKFLIIGTCIKNNYPNCPENGTRLYIIAVMLPNYADEMAVYQTV